MKAASTGNNPEAGNSALEILIALGILTLAMTAIIQVVFSNQTVVAENQVNSEALSKASAILEKARAQARQDFAGTISSSSTDDIYLKDLIITDLTQCRKQLTASVSWSTDPSRPEKIELTSEITDVSLGGDCASLVATVSWDVLDGPWTVNLPNNQATGIDVKNKIIFLSTDAGSTNKPDLFIINAANPKNPVLIGPGFDIGSKGLNAVDAAGNYVYAANQNSTGQLQIINVANLAAPAVIASRSLPGVGGSSPEGNTISYYNSRVYIGTKFTAGDEFHIYDVSSPASPTNLGHKEVGRNVNGIFVQGTMAYLSVGSSAGDLKDVIAYDVSNPSSITEKWSLNLPGGGGKSIYIVGKKMYIGCFKMNGKKDFYVYDITNPLSPVLLGQTQIGADVNGIRVAGKYAFLATSLTHKELQVWDISDPANIQLISSAQLANIAVGIDYDDNTVYTGVRSNESLSIITPK